MSDMAEDIPWIINPHEVTTKDIHDRFVNIGDTGHGFTGANPACVCAFSRNGTEHILVGSYNKAVKGFQHDGRERKGRHAEEDIQEHIIDKNLISPEGKLIIYSTYSPCDDCCKRICKWIDDFRLEIANFFSTLYRIKRPSCEGRRCACTDDEYNNLRVSSLKDLGSRCVLRPFNQATWDEFGKVLDKIQYYRSIPPERILEDALMARDCKELGLELEALNHTPFYASTSSCESRPARPQKRPVEKESPPIGKAKRRVITKKR